MHRIPQQRLTAAKSEGAANVGTPRVALVHATDGSDVRVGKTCRSLSRMGLDVHFVGWDRRPGQEKMLDLGTATAHVLRLETRHARWSASGQVTYLAHIVKVLREVRPQVVCAVNEELAALLLPFRGVFYGRLVCELYDSLQARQSGRSRTVRLVAGAVTKMAHRFSDRLIATDRNRMNLLGRYADKAVVVQNVPEDPGDELSKRIPKGPIKIWAAGTLDETRGLRRLLDAVESLPDVTVVSAGWAFDSYATDVFLRSTRVEYHGIVSAARSLELAAGCDAIYCYYAPLNSNMINASPNKIHDALAVGRPVLINAEVLISSWVSEHAIGYVCPYDEVACLRRAIAQLPAARLALPEYAARCRALFRQQSWSSQEPTLSDLYRSLTAVDE